MHGTTRCLAALLGTAMLLSPLSAAADDTETITLPPPSEKLPPFVGTLSVSCDRSMNGSRFEIYRIQDEGTFLHYSYDIALREDFTAVCPLCDGDFQLVLYVPGEHEERDVYRYELTMQDADMLPSQEQTYTETQMTFRFRTDADLTAPAEQMQDAVIEDGVLRQEQQYTLPRAELVLGDLNADGLTDAADATEILIAAAAVGAGDPCGLSSLQAAAADLDGSGSFDPADATDLLIYAAGKGSGNLTSDVLTYMRSVKADS